MAVQISTEVSSISESASRGTVRNHTVTCDRPEAKGGTNEGPMGGELFLLGLGSCFMSNLLAAIQTRDLQITDIKASIVGNLDGTPPKFTEISMKLSGSFTNKDEFEKLILIAERGCIVANSIKDVIKLDITVEGHNPKAQHEET